jgi:hypothetical protein
MVSKFNRLNSQLNPIYYLLELLKAHPILHVSRIRDTYRTAAPLYASDTRFVSSCILVNIVHKGDNKDDDGDDNNNNNNNNNMGTGII